jgi:hypothetical protein
MQMQMQMQMKMQMQMHPEREGPADAAGPSRWFVLQVHPDHPIMNGQNVWNVCSRVASRPG